MLVRYVWVGLLATSSSLLAGQIHDMGLAPGSSPTAPDIVAHGANPSDFLGGLVASGDLNGDGVDDLITASSIGPVERSDAGQVRIWFGSELIGGPKDAAGLVGELPDLKIIGAAFQGRTTVNGLLKVADVNGDDVDDLLLGTPFSNGRPGNLREYSGSVHVIYGRKSPAAFPAVIDLAKQNDGVVTDGADVTIHGPYRNASSVSLPISPALWMESADVNGDGISDLLLSFAGGLSGGNGYVLFGRPPQSPFPKEIDLYVPPGGTLSNGFQIDPSSSTDFLGIGERLRAGDVNGDGIADIVVASAGTATSLAKVFVVFGKGPGSSFPPVVSLARTNSGVISDGADVVLRHANNGDVFAGSTGVVVAASLRVADVNGDGVDDILASSPLADGPGEARASAGEVSIVFGRKLPAVFPPLIDLALRNPAAGGSGADVTLYGSGVDSYLAESAALKVMDLNGDSVGDVIMGERLSDGPSGTRANAGALYVVFGKKLPATFPPEIDLLKRNGSTITDGSDMLIHGASPGDSISGFHGIHSADVSGDGVEDLFIVAPSAGGPSDARPGAGEVSVVFGRRLPVRFPSVLDLAVATSWNLMFYGANPQDALGSFDGVATGDFNRDGLKDVVLGSWLADGPSESRQNSGETYVIFGGQNSVQVPPLVMSRGTGDEVQLRYVGTPGLTYQIQRATSMSNWSGIGRVMADSEGVVLFEDIAPPDPAAFYRILRP